MTQGYQFDQSLPLRFFKSVFDNVLLENGGLPHVLGGVVARKILVTA